MADYTPTTAEIRDDYVLMNTRNFDAYQVGRSLASEQEHYGDQFDRWLAAHDAEVRAEEGAEDRELLDRIWSAFGCEAHPDSFKPEVRERIWGQIEEMARESAAGATRISRELASAERAIVAERLNRAALERIASECEADIPQDDGNETAKLIGKRIREALALPDESAKRPEREQMIYRARATEGEVVGPERTSPEMAKEAYWQALALHPFDMEDETPLVESRPQVPWQPLALEPEAREITDAAVVRALIAYGYSENDLRFDPGVRMRAALEAAAAATDG